MISASPSRHLQSIARCSLAVGLIGLLLGGYLLAQSLHQTSDAEESIRQLSARGPFVVGFGDQLGLCLWRGLSIVLGVLLAVPLLLIGGACLLTRSNPRGVTVHWMYVPLQLIAGVVLLMYVCGNSRSGIAFDVTAILTLLVCVYPLILIPWLIYAGRPTL